jgi:hypothetical protein
MRTGAFLAFLSCATVIVVACGGGESNAGDDAYRASGARAARNAVLALEDLPGGWAARAPGAPGYTDFELSGDCAQLNGRGAGFAGEVASADSEPFTGPLGQELINTVTAFDSPASAAAAVSLANELVPQCADQLEDALRKAIELAAEDRNLDRLLGDIDATVEPVEFTTFGEETMAYSLHADFSALFQRFEVNGHIIVIRDGALTGVLAYAVLGDNDSQGAETLATALAQKLVNASEDLLE